MNVHMSTCTPVATTIDIDTLCPKCGIIEKSGKISCCGRGGSWFSNCGSGGNSKLDHTWSEGIRVCKTRTQSKIGISQRLRAVQQLNVSSGTGATNLNVVGKIFIFSSTNTTSKPSITTMLMSLVQTSIDIPRIASDSTSTEYGAGTSNLKTFTTTSKLQTAMTAPMTGHMSSPTLTNMSVNTSVVRRGNGPARTSSDISRTYISTTATATRLSMMTTAIITVHETDAVVTTNWITQGACHTVL